MRNIICSPINLSLVLLIFIILSAVIVYQYLQIKYLRLLHGDTKAIPRYNSTNTIPQIVIKEVPNIECLNRSTGDVSTKHEQTKQQLNNNPVFGVAVTVFMGVSNIS